MDHFTSIVQKEISSIPELNQSEQFNIVILILL